VVFNGQANAEDLLKSADLAMYESKNAGRNRVVVKQYEAGEAVVFDPGKPILSLTWHPSYCCGESIIDDAHRKLFELANRLIEAQFSRTEDPQRFDVALEALLAHVVQHFAEEEAILARYHYSELAEHAHAHKVLLEHVVQLRNRGARGEVDIGELVNFLAADVIAQHLLKTDRKFFTLFSATAPVKQA
jgi:hemerythrin-like metal-binding protein